LREPVADRTRAVAAVRAVNFACGESRSGAVNFSRVRAVWSESAEQPEEDV
jgi:hypothetical protein